MLEIVKAIGQEQMKNEIPAFEIGDTVRVHNRIVEGKNERIQMFEGTVSVKRILVYLQHSL